MSFKPDIIHSHHPFLLGDAALRVARHRELPILFTHHTLYERYTHYVPLDSPALKRMAVRLSAEYCNLCDRIVAPSESIATLLKERGVETPSTPFPPGLIWMPSRAIRAKPSETRKASPPIRP